MELNVTITEEAREAITNDQRVAVGYLMRNPAIERLRVMKGGFDLPDGYLYFQQIYPSPLGSSSTDGGIAPDGRIST